VPPVRRFFFVVAVLLVILVVLVVLVLLIILIIFVILLLVIRSRLFTVLNSRPGRYNLGNVDANGAGNG